MIMETEIIDSGIGISIERQQYLFQPFKELKSNPGIHNGIGLGLTCS
jgi:signal transduction histidine kinase